MSSKPKWLQILAEFLIDNFTVLLTIGFAGYTIYRREAAQVVVSTDELLTAILGVLGLLATSEIVERYRRLGTIEKSVKRALSLLESRFTERPSAIAFFEKLPDIDSCVHGASQIDLCGVTLTSTINRQFSNLRECLEQGATIRLLIIDPDSLAPQMAAHRVKPADVDYYRTRLEAVLRDIDYLHKSWAEYQMRQSSLSKKGNLSARLLPYVPSFGLLSFDANRPNGIVFVEVYPHGTGHKTQPTFDLTPHGDGIWYGYFLDQFEQMWNSAKPWNPKTAANAREESTN